MTLIKTSEDKWTVFFAIMAIANFSMLIYAVSEAQWQPAAYSFIGAFITSLMTLFSREMSKLQLALSEVSNQNKGE